MPDFIFLSCLYCPIHHLVPNSTARHAHSIILLPIKLTQAQAA